MRKQGHSHHEFKVFSSAATIYRYSDIYRDMKVYRDMMYRYNTTDIIFSN